MSKFDDFKKGLKKVFQQDPEAKKNFKGTATVTGAFAGAAAAFTASKGKPAAALIGAVVGGVAGYKGAGKVLADIDATKDSVPSPDPFAGIKRKRAAKNEAKEAAAPETGTPAAPKDAASKEAPKEAKEAKPAASPRRKRGGPKPD
jgi:hypothetical protein